jgi:hypothetical protein
MARDVVRNLAPDAIYAEVAVDPSAGEEADCVSTEDSESMIEAYEADELLAVRDITRVAEIGPLPFESSRGVAD